GFVVGDLSREEDSDRRRYPDCDGPDDLRDHQNDHRPPLEGRGGGQCRRHQPSTARAEDASRTTRNRGSPFFSRSSSRPAASNGARSIIARMPLSTAKRIVSSTSSELPVM